MSNAGGITKTLQSDKGFRKPIAKSRARLLPAKTLGFFMGPVLTPAGPKAITRAKARYYYRLGAGTLNHFCVGRLPGPPRPAPSMCKDARGAVELYDLCTCQHDAGLSWPPSFAGYLHPCTLIIGMVGLKANYFLRERMPDDTLSIRKGGMREYGRRWQLLAAGVAKVPIQACTVFIGGGETVQLFRELHPAVSRRPIAPRQPQASESTDRSQRCLRRASRPARQSRQAQGMPRLRQATGQAQTVLPRMSQKASTSRLPSGEAKTTGGCPTNYGFGPLSIKDLWRCFERVHTKVPFSSKWAQIVGHSAAGACSFASIISIALITSILTISIGLSVLAVPAGPGRIARFAPSPQASGPAYQLAGTLASPASGWLGPDTRQLFDAIRHVESGGNDKAVGDGGRSRGPYQIGAAYWQDACEHSGSQWDYLNLVWSAPHCEQIMLWYWSRYCPEALANNDWETLARVHNGGPKGASKRATEGYWRKVRQALLVRMKE